MAAAMETAGDAGGASPSPANRGRGRARGASVEPERCASPILANRGPCAQPPGVPSPPSSDKSGTGRGRGPGWASWRRIPRPVLPRPHPRTGADSEHSVADQLAGFFDESHYESECSQSSSRPDQEARARALSPTKLPTTSEFTRLPCEEFGPVGWISGEYGCSVCYRRRLSWSACALPASNGSRRTHRLPGLLAEVVSCFL